MNQAQLKVGYQSYLVLHKDQTDVGWSQLYHRQVIQGWELLQDDKATDNKSQPGAWSRKLITLYLDFGLDQWIY